jgi:general stress protein 26
MIMFTEDITINLNIITFKTLIESNMKSLHKYIFLIALIFQFSTFTSMGQQIEFNDSSIAKLTTAAREIMSAAGTCALITLDEEGRPRVRAMDPFAPESDFTVWFGTNSKSRKVNQIENDPRVTLYYLDGDASGYVMIHGRAQLINDLFEKEKRWKDTWEAFYKDKTEDYLLIKVSPIWMEVSSTSRGIYGDTITWEPPKVIFESVQ